MLTQSTFNFFVTQTISNSFFHFILILFEYVLFLCPSSLNAAIKLNLFFNHSNDSSDQLAFLLDFIEPKTTPGIIFLLALFFLIIYYLIIFFELEKYKGIQFVKGFFVFVFDIVLIRYFSMLVFHCSSLIFIQLYSADELAYSVLAVIMFIFYFFYAFTAYTYIKHQMIPVYIINPLLVSKPRIFPYDRLSQQYDLILVLLKAIIAIEHNYSHSTKQFNYITTSLNICILLLNLIQLAFFYYSSYQLLVNSTLFYSRTLCNYTRKVLVIFNCSMSIWALFVFSGGIISIKNIIITIIISLNITLFVMLGENFIYLNILINKQTISFQVVLFLLINSITADSSTYKRIQNSCLINHQFKCNNCECSLCLQFSDNPHENIRIFYDYCKKEAKKHKKQHKATHEEELTKLFFYKITKRSFKFLKYYYYLIHRYENSEKDFVRSLVMIVDNWLIKSNNEGSTIIENLIAISELETSMKTLLEGFSSFANQQLKLKQPEQVIGLSDELKAIMLKLKQFTKESSKLLSQASTDNNSKLINSALDYILMLLRFSFETLINQPLSEIPPLFIEVYEDNLNIHYHSDHVLICSIDLQYIFNKEFKLIKVTGPLAHKANQHKFLSDYFPKAIKREGNNFLHQQLQQVNFGYTEQKSFLFPFISSGVLDYIKYSFSFLETVKNNNIILYGQYSKESHRSLLIDITDPAYLVVLSFSKEILKLLHIKSKWMVYLDEAKYKFILQSLFKTVSINGESSSIDCVFDYDFFLSKTKFFLQELRSIEAFAANANNEKAITEEMNELKKHSGKTLTFALEKKVEFPQANVVLYEVNIKGKFTVISPSEIIKGGVEWDYGKNDSMMWNLHSNTYSSSVSNDYSVISNKKAGKAKTSEFNVLNQALKAKIEKESKVFQWHSFILLGLNLILLLLCIVFLFTQINQTQTLSNLSNLFFRFKTIRLCFVNFFVTLASTVCFSATPTTQLEDCGLNGYERYNKFYREKYGLDDQFNFIQFISTELLLKADYAQNLLLDFKRILDSYSNLDFESIISNPMVYYEFEEKEGLNIANVNITFEEGMRQYINSMFIIQNSTTPYSKIPIYFISYSNGTYYLDNIPSKSLSIIQKEIYKGLFNYINFYFSFKKGEDSIRNNIEIVSQSNSSLNIVFMIAIILLNLLLLFLCQRSIVVAYHLFKVLILNVVYTTEDKEFLLRFNAKLDCLQSLVRLYDRNPNEIIKRITSGNSGMSRRKEKATQEQEQSQLALDELMVSFGSKFYYSLLGRLIFILASLFSLFFIIIVVFDVVIFTSFQKVLKIFEYIQLQYNYENSVFIIISFTVLSYIGNVSSEELSLLMARENPEDGILNSLARESYVQFIALTDYIALNSKDYPTLQNELGGSCEEIFDKMNDSYVTRVSQLTGIDYHPLPKSICKSFDLLNVPNFAYIRLDLVQRAHKLINANEGRSYTAIYSFINSLELYEMYSISLFVYRLLCTFFRNNLLLPTISEQFDFYVILVGVYLGVNILMELFVFVMVRWFISAKLKKIQNNLYIINNCVN